MLDILDTFLNNSASPELKSLIKEAIDIFDKIGYTGTESLYNEKLMNSDNEDLNDTLLSILSVTKDAQIDILLAHDIKVNKDIPFDIANALIDGIINIETHENKNEILNIISANLSTEETFAEIIELLTGKNADELLLHIESVGQQTIEATKYLLIQKSVNDDVEEKDNEDMNKSIVLVKKFYNYLKGRKLLISKLLNDGMDIGLKFATYASILGRDLEELTPTVAAEELIGMALISIDGVNNPRAIIKENIDKYISNLDTITKIDIAIGNILLELQK